MYTTDRQIIERLLIPALMLVVLTAMRRTLGEYAGVLDPIHALLDEALREPVADLPPERVAKLVRRSKRVTTQAMTAVINKVLGVQYLSLALFTADLAARDVIIIGPESPFAKAWDLMAEIMDLADDDLLRSEAESAARELARVLGGMGFYAA